MGFFTLELARRVGPTGRVIAVDVQPKMIERLRRRAATANLAERIDARVTRVDSMQLNGLESRVDFVLAFAVVHEIPETAAFFSEAAASMKPGARMLLADPLSQVSDAEFDNELEIARGAGLETEARPAIRRGRTALLLKDSSLIGERAMLGAVGRLSTNGYARYRRKICVNYQGK
jgi:ubiquinone/menaquinone biosynthesis C-methylase UbiE